MSSPSSAESASSAGSTTGANARAEQASAAGPWHGTLQAPGAQVPLAITFRRQGTKLTGSIDIPTQGIAGQPLTQASQSETEITFAIKRVAGAPADPAFVGRLDGDAIEGTFSQAGQSFPLTLNRGELPTPARPQEPAPPFPYQSEDVTYSSGVTLAGTLTLPEGDGPFPAVLLITGSGAQDRDETILGHKPFLLIADTLTRAGYAVLRVDDRGVGGTSGVLGDADYDDLAGDALAGLRYLRGRPDIKADAVGLLGHSEGGYLAPLVAQRAEVDFTILVAGPAVPGADLLVEQNKLLLAASGAPPEAVDAQVAFIGQLAGLLQSGDLAAADGLIRKRLAEQGGSSEQADHAAALANEITRALVTYDPGPALAALRAPVLAVFGGRDLQVPAAQNEPAMRQLLAGDPDATVRTFPELNHLMQPATTGLPGEFALTETTMDPRVLQLFTSWLTQRFPPT